MKEISVKLRLIEKIVLAGTVIAVVSFILLLVFARWPNWWELTVPELSPLTWIESLLLFLIAVVSGLAAALSYLRSDRYETKLWLIFGVSFLYLTLDERFAIHERIRDSYLAPRQIKIPPFFWTQYGDFLLLLFFVAGLFVAVKIISLLKSRRTSYRLFVLGIGLAAAAILLDSFQFTMYSLEIQRLEQFFEEMLETGAMLTFFGAISLIVGHYLQQLLEIDKKN